MVIEASFKVDDEINWDDLHVSYSGPLSHMTCLINKFGNKNDGMCYLHDFQALQVLALGSHHSQLNDMNKLELPSV